MDFVDAEYSRIGTVYTPKTSINPIVRKTLPATPAFPILCGNMVISTHPKSTETKILIPKYPQKKFDTIQHSFPLRRTAFACLLRVARFALQSGRNASAQCAQ